MQYTYDPFHSIGFDRIFDRLQALSSNQKSVSYPPFNITKTSDDSYRIEIAAAGFSQEDIDITLHNQNLKIVGNTAPTDAEYLHKGIAQRAFERTFTLADHVKVQSANMVNGMLHIDLINKVPEEQKPKKVAIGQQLLIE